jgi:hypothetical protein
MGGVDFLGDSDLCLLMCKKQLRLRFPCFAARPADDGRHRQSGPSGAASRPDPKNSLGAFLQPDPMSGMPATPPASNPAMRVIASR